MKELNELIELNRLKASAFDNIEKINYLHALLEIEKGELIKTRTNIIERENAQKDDSDNTTE